MGEIAVNLEREDLTLKVNEIFYSIQGEGSYALYPCAFIRLSACNLRCTWCDTTYSFHEGQTQALSAIANEVAAYNTRLVELTGGEPLLQRNVYELMHLLHERDYTILLETSGSILIDQVPGFVHIVLDMKAPGSGEQNKNKYENLKLLKKTDDLKIVIKDRADFDFAVELLGAHAAQLQLARPPILQPVFGELDPGQLGEWIKECPMPLRLGLQLHKYLYEPSLRAV